MAQDCGLRKPSELSAQICQWLTRDVDEAGWESSWRKWRMGDLTAPALP
jgi:hypothetical protein